MWLRRHRYNPGSAARRLGLLNSIADSPRRRAAWFSGSRCSAYWQVSPCFRNPSDVWPHRTIHTFLSQSTAAGQSGQTYLNTVGAGLPLSVTEPVHGKVNRGSLRKQRGRRRPNQAEIHTSGLFEGRPEFREDFVMQLDIPVRSPHSPGVGEKCRALLRLDCAGKSILG